MALHNAKPGLGSVPEYQASGIPASGVLTLDQVASFTRVTKAIVVWSTAASTIHFGDSGQAVDIAEDFIYRFEIKTKTLVNTSNTNLNFVAELTNIAAGRCETWDNTNDEWYTIVSP